MAEPHPLRLDRSRYHASVHGDFDSRVRFFQDGRPFDAHGCLCGELCDAVQLAAAGAPRRAPEIGSQKSEAGMQGTDSDFRLPTSDLAEGDVNLKPWVSGQVRYLPGAVFAAIRERYNKSVTTSADAIDSLVDDLRLVSEHEAAPALPDMGGVPEAKEEA
jgi:hypothetical protein